MILNRATSQLLKMANFKLGLALLSTALLAACGGGDSSSSSSSSSSLTLNLNAAYENHTKGGSSITGTISGYCQGTRVWTLSPTFSGTTLDGKPALLQNEYELDNLAANSNEFCKTFYSSNDISKVKYTIYYDPNTLVPISSGSNPPTTVYENQVPFPTSVSDGSSGKWFNTISFEKGIPVATGIQTWEVRADTPTTLMFITNNKAYTSVGNLLLFNQTTYYRLNANNTLTPLRKNIQPTTLLTGDGDQNIDEVYQQK
ncbi:MAG: hypothetical protein HQ457_04990 [Betaproteobacteria bacterium]|nr:hypothetical protein [Betaproteobacteria bacterium]